MLNIFAKRKLEKERQNLQEELTRLVPTKGAEWFNNYELVLINLREKFPNQITDVRALCCVVAHGILGLMSLPENIIDESKTADLLHYIRQHSLPEETAQWAVFCWAEVLSELPRSKRYEMASEIRRREEAQSQAKVERELHERQAEAEREVLRHAEEEALRHATREADRRRECYQAEAAKQREQRRPAEAAEQKRRRQIEAVEQERLRQIEAAIEVAKLKTQAEVTQNQHLIKCWRLTFPTQLIAIEEAASTAAQIIEQEKVTKSKADIDEQWRREVGEPEEGTTWLKTEKRGAEDWAKAGALKKRFAQERIAETELFTDAEILRRIQADPNPEALKQKIEKVWQAEENRIRVQEHRERFPIQVAGLTDEEVLKQIEGTK